MVHCETGANLARARTLFLRIVAICFACAFISLYPQVAGLYGPNGVLPVYMILKPTTDVAKLSQAMAERPTLLNLCGIIGIAPHHMMELLCLLGTAIGLVAAVWPTYGSKLSFLIQWIFYLSIVQVGQTFLRFQWDILLLEVGFLSILVAPLRGSTYLQPRPRDHVCMMLVRWLLFRMMFASGVVKLTSGCPTWWGLTAMPLHYESQCIPTPLAWFAHRWLPEASHQLSVIFTYVIEIPLTFFFFAPTTFLRKFTFVAQVFLMIVIMASGNYNFFNLLFVGLCVSLVDDSWFWRSPPRSSWIVRMVTSLINFAGVVALIYFTTVFFFDLKSGFTPKIMFTKSDFAKFVSISTKAGLVLGGVALAFSSLLALYKSLFPSSGSKGCFARLINLLSTLFYIGLAASVFVASLPVFTRGVGQPLPDGAPKSPAVLKEAVEKFSLIHSYGLFRRMTGVGGRPEIIIEGADSRAGPWKEYEFLYKPGNVSVAPRFCLPHQPRLDWQMWFAALGTAEQNPWFISLVYRLLQNQKDVIRLLDVKRNPFPKQAPKLIRAKLFLYQFTDVSYKSDWWQREEKSEYLQLFSVDQESLVQYLEQVGIISSVKTVPKTKIGFVSRGLKWLRQQSSKVEPHILVWSVGCLIIPVLFGV